MQHAHWLTTSRADGDFRIDGPSDEVAGRRRALVDLPWVWLRQVHGAVVHVVEGPAAATAVAGREGDALVTAAPGVVLAVQSADCAPLVFRSPEGVVAVAHAGWRGLLGGVIEATVATMRELGATDVEGTLGPCIGSECYEFGTDALQPLVEAYGDRVRVTGPDGGVALDLAAGVVQAAGAVGVTLGGLPPACTACDPDDRWFSYRARHDQGRMATVVWCEVPR